MIRRAISWGRWPQQEAAAEVPLTNRFAELTDTGHRMLAFGNGRSYGDVCLNEGGASIHTRGLDRFIYFDPRTGVLECEAGVLISEIIDLAIPYGLFPPVTPGTAMVTVGGAIANDVHGKNHHRFGCFSHHVLEFELLRSDGTRLDCSLQKNAEWFRATVGGLGLTGLITRVKLQLRQVAGVSIRGHSQRFANLDEFFELSRSTDDAYEYTVAWIDCTASGAATGRGVFICGNHAQGPAAELTSKPIPLRVPFTPPVSLINGLSMGMLNQLYLRRAKSRRDAIWHYRSFLYPLDAIRDWNRIYGPRGFFQYQCVIPEGYAPDSIRRMLLTIREYRAGSFLSVLKTFGPTASLGMLSFARPGTTLALDFPNHGKRTMQLLEALDEITRSAGGAVYPAKDARMSSRSFQEYYPAWRTFATYVDPKFSSSFWRRVTEGSA